MATPDRSRRSYGTGALFEHANSAGRVSWYGKWRANGVQVKRRIGPKRMEGGRDGLTRRAAEAELRRLMATVQPSLPVGEAVTIGELGRRFMVHQERMGRKKSTRAAVESSLRVHLEPFFGERVVNSITHEHVADLVVVLEQRGLGPKSIRNCVGALSAMINFARAPQRRWITGNPCEGLELPAVPERDGFRYLTLEQVDALVRGVAPGPHGGLDAAMYRTAAMTGLRLGEMIALRWRDVDWSASAIRVRSNYVLGEFGTPKSRRSTRSVPMADEVAGALERHYQAAGCPGDDELVFPDPRTGRPLDKAAVLRRMRKALAAAGLDESHCVHDLRHTFGTAMAAGGVPIRTLQEWMGHRDIQTTQRYADYAPRARDAGLVAAAFRRPDAAPVAAALELGGAREVIEG